MTTLKRWWRSLESVIGLAEVTRAWEKLLGPEYEPMAGFLRPSGALAQSVPCPAEHDCGCAHYVVEHSPDHAVAVCQCEPQRCDTFPVAKSDRVIFEVNQSLLGTALASALGIEPEFEKLRDSYMTFRLGTYSPLAGYEFPVFLCIQFDPYELQMAMATLIATLDSPIIVLVPTRDLVNPTVMDMVNRRGCCLLALENFINIEGGMLIAHPPLETLLSKFKDLHVPAFDDQSSMTFFSTPPGSSWENVSVRFVDGHKVAVRVKSERGIFNYTQMGMASAKNGEPTVQWKLLQDFAEERGVITWRSPKADPNLKRRKSSLASNLYDFFRIKGDPFIYDENAKGWRARFTIEPE